MSMLDGDRLKNHGRRLSFKYSAVFGVEFMFRRLDHRY